MPYIVEHAQVCQLSLHFRIKASKALLQCSKITFLVLRQPQMCEDKHDWTHVCKNFATCIEERKTMTTATRSQVKPGCKPSACCGRHLNPWWTHLWTMHETAYQLLQWSRCDLLSGRFGRYVLKVLSKQTATCKLDQMLWLAFGEAAVTDDDYDDKT